VRDADYPPELLSSVTALKLSEQEAQVVAGGSPFGSDEAAALGVPEVLLTLGSRGVTVFTDDGETLVTGRAVEDVNATGAGDTFMVAYAAERAAGRDTLEAAEQACTFVSEVLEARKSAP
jgi:sugar/nucleoside kinase (ribokinase family)